MRTLLLAAAAALLLAAPPVRAQEWSLEKAAEPLKGTEVRVDFLDRPGYRAVTSLIPEFERRTGIKVSYETVPFETLHEKQALDFAQQSGLTVALVDVVWLGEFADKGWLVPADTFLKDAALADPASKPDGFFPQVLNALGAWDGKLYGLPVVPLAGVLYYNRCTLHDAGFDGPPASWEDLATSYAPKLTDKDHNRYAYALPSLRGETQVADSFMRFLRPFGGALLTPELRSALGGEGSQRGLAFRQQLMGFVPPGTIGFDHPEVLNAFSQGRVAMISEWSSFFPTLADPKTSKVANCLGVAPEPEGPAGRAAPFGGFSLAVAAHASDRERKAAWLFIQWVTGEQTARPLLEAGGFPARRSAYEAPDAREGRAVVDPMLAVFANGPFDYRPRFPAWPAISNVIADWGSRMQAGEVAVDAGAQEIGRRMEDILGREGYYDKKRPPLQ